MSHRIEIACDNDEAEHFAAWLAAQGHEARIGDSTGSYVDGIRVSTSPEADGIFTSLWNDYCDAG